MSRYEDPKPRDAMWLATERVRLSRWPREKLLEWLAWNDPNGTYLDKDMGDDEEPLMQEEALDIVMRSVEDSMETPEEMRAEWARRRG